MKILRITTAYPIYIKKLYSQSVLSENEDFRTQYKKLCFQCYGWADFWSRAFGKLGYECWEPVANVEPLQKKWAQENGYKFDEKNWLLDIQTEQAKRYKPDILFINDYSTYNYNFITELRKKVPSIKFVMGWCGAPYSDVSVFNAYDLLLTNLPSYYKSFTSMGHKCSLVRHAFDPEILNRIGKTEKSGEFSFLGSVVKGSEYHNERIQLLTYLVSKTDIKIYSDLQPENFSIYKSVKRKKFIQDFLNFFLSGKGRYVLSLRKRVNRMFKLESDYAMMMKDWHSEELVKRAYPGLFGLDMYRKLASSGVTLNQHIDISRGSSNNMRLYEATGVGTCLLTDWSEDLAEKFEDGKEVVSYKSKEELLEKLKFLRSNPGKVEEIGRNAQARTLRENNFFNRAEYLHSIIKKYT